MATAPKFIPKKTLQAVIDTMSTGTDGEVYWTELGSQYVVSSTGALVKTTDIIKVNSLPTSNQRTDKLYLLKSDTTIRTWNGSSWDSYGSPSYVLNPATNTTLGGVKIGNGLNIDSNGLTSTKLGVGLTFDSSNNVIVDSNNVDITQLKNYSTLNIGSPMGFFDSTATLSTFSNAQKGSFWIYNGSSNLTLGGRTFTSGDQLWCTSTISGTPANLTTSFAYVPDALATATTTTTGAVKLGSATPLMDESTASVGTSIGMAREDHVHPSDSTKISKVASSTTNGVVTWSDTTGLVLKDSTKLLPTGVIVGDADIQTLQNKKLQDTTTTIVNTTDNTKAIKFDASGNTTAITGTLKTNFTTAKTINLPDKTGTIAIAPNVITLSSSGNITLVENTIYEVTNLAVVGSVLTLPNSASSTGSYIQILVAVSGFDDSHTFILNGTINGAANTIINNRSFVEYKFYYSASTSNWILASSNSGY